MTPPSSPAAFELARYQDPLTIQRVLLNAKTIAIVGLSKNELRASYFVGYYLKRHGFHVIPVNPRETEILGEKSFKSLADVPVPVDVVNVFRAPDALPGIAQEAVQIGAGSIWCQFGVINAEGAGIAESGGVSVIMDRCIKVEHARYAGRMHWLGFNTGRITSIRGGLQYRALTLGFPQELSMRIASAVALVLLFTAPATGLAQRGTAPQATAGTAADATARIVASAQALVTTLDDAGRARVQFPFEGPQKTRWSNFPSPMFKREGLRLGDLTAAQRTAVTALLTTALSEEGYRKVLDIMRGDEVLKQNQSGRGGPPGGGGRGGGVQFGQDEYYLAFVGTPSVTSPWMLQFGGHHLAINLTMAGSQATMAPSLPAAQPASYTLEGRMVRPLGDETDKAFALINALGEAERKQAVLTYRVSDLVLGPGQDGRTIQPEGIRASALSASQQTMLLDLIAEWTGIQHDAFAGPRMTEIKANLPQTYFAWSGPITPGSAAYFRIQGPTLVIEYAPQQGSVDHIHTIYRDPTNDYGARFVRK
jgi:predicted CoA-binding protein